MRQRRIRVMKSDQVFKKAAADLSRILLAPVADLLGGKRILIHTEGFLQHLSFASLPIPESLAGSAEYIPLMARNEIILVGSESIRARRSKRSSEKGRISIWADPVFAGDDPRLLDTGGGRSPNRDDPLSRGDVGTENEPVCRLPHSGHEAEAIMNLLPPDKVICHLDLKANRDNVLRAKHSSYRILHIATHATENGLILSAYDEEFTRVESILSLEDIQSMELHAELVVLSACNTARPGRAHGSCKGSLAEAFLAAGAEKVLACLWAVDDEATKEFIEFFYEDYLLEKNMTASAALRSAQMKLRRHEKWSEPYYWAPFVLIEGRTRRE
jgi:CHAT domain-containing protein